MQSTELLPLDWEETGGSAHGITRSERQRGYLACLLLMGKQYYFGPFKLSRLEAATAYSRLMKYFLPFCKSKPEPNHSAEVFFEFDDRETEELYGADRLIRLRKKLTESLVSVGVDLDAQRKSREDYIRSNHGAKCAAARATTARDTARRRSLIALETKALRLAESYELVDLVRGLTIPAERLQEKVVPQLNITLAAYDELKTQLAQLISDCKLALDLNPDITTR